jgi:hypothetical protein
LIRLRSSAILNEATLSRRRSDVGLGQIALGSAPVFGGAMLAIAAGQFRGTDYRGVIKEDMDLLDRLPEDATERRAELQRSIEARIDDLIYAADRGRALRRADVLPGQLAGHCAVALRAAVHDHLVGR